MIDVIESGSPSTTPLRRIPMTEAELCGFIESQRPYLLFLVKANFPSFLNGKTGHEDVVQKALQKAVRKCAEVNSNRPDSIRSWLRTILANTLADEIKHFRADKRDIRREVEISNDLDQSHAGLAELVASGHTPPSQAAIRNEEFQRTITALNDLPPVERIAVTLKFLKGKKIKEIASELQCSEREASKLATQGLARLQKMLL